MNNYIERIAGYYKETSTHELLAQLPVAEKVKIAISAAIEDSRHPAPKHADLPRSGPSPQATIPGLDNMSKDLAGELGILKETAKGAIVCNIKGTDFWIFPSAAELMTKAKFYKGAEVKARIQERKFKDGKSYWMCIGMDANPGDDIP